MKKIIKISIISILSVMIFFLLIVLRLYLVRPFDLSNQSKELKKLYTKYETSDYKKIDENQFVNFDLSDETIHLNEIQMIASHNSYKKQGPAIGRFFVGLGDSFEEAKALKYEYKNITEQLESGVRSFELDIRYRNQKFELTHVPLVDPSSVAVSFEMLLEEIYLFSTYQENHIPIIILMEIKDDWMILDPMLKIMDEKAFNDFDALIKDKIKDHLFTPSDMLDGQTNLRDTIMGQGWPSIPDMLNQVIFIMHPGTASTTYYEMDQSLMSHSMFIGSYYTENPLDYASFFVQNEIDELKISDLIDNNFIVRTRIDSNLVFNQTMFTNAVNSGAQILSTDFSVGRKDIDEIDYIYLEQNKMIIKKE